MAWRVTGALMTTLILVACGGPNLTTLRQRASFDLDCPMEQLEAVDLPGEAAGVTGCGMRATYVEICQHGPYGSRVDCTWVLNTR